MVYTLKRLYSRLGFLLLALTMLSACAVQHLAGLSPEKDSPGSGMTFGDSALEIDNDPVSVLAAWEGNRTNFTIPDPEFSTLSADDDSGGPAMGEYTLNKPRKIVFNHRNKHDLWDRIRRRFALPDHDHPRTNAEKRWYEHHQEYIDRTITRARPYLQAIFVPCGKACPAPSPRR